MEPQVRRMVISEGTGCYHVVSRVVERRFIFGDAEKAKFRSLMGNLLAFSGIECVTYCLMSNHFHLLLVVPDGEGFRAQASDDEWVLDRARHIYGEAEWVAVRDELMRLRRVSPAAADALRERYVRRMFDLSEFMKELKVRFSRWYNRRNARKGTLWEERFRSVIVEDAIPDHGSGGGCSWEIPGSALMAVAAYIDLNPVRAGLVDDPKDFRWSGYGEAASGVVSARRGIRRAVGSARWREVQRVYRVLLYDIAEERPETGDEEAPGGSKGGLRREDAARVRALGGRLTLPQLLRCRVRYFTYGAAIGSREFLNALFEKHRRKFGPKRNSGARRMRSGDWNGLMAMRDLGSGTDPCRRVGTI